MCITHMLIETSLTVIANTGVTTHPSGFRKASMENLFTQWPWNFLLVVGWYIALMSPFFRVERDSWS